jgi:thiamine biosynthesis protein ThiS
VIRVNGRPQPWQDGMTVSDLLETVKNAHFYAVVRINGDTVSRPHFGETRIPDGAEIYLVPMIAGG